MNQYRYVLEIYHSNIINIIKRFRKPTSLVNGFDLLGQTQNLLLDAPASDSQGRKYSWTHFHEVFKLFSCFWISAILIQVAYYVGRSSISPNTHSNHGS
jgi:hypothetical protein